MPKAEKDGVIEVGGVPLTIRAGEEYPEGATFRETDQVVPADAPPSPKDEASGSKVISSKAAKANG